MSKGREMNCEHAEMQLTQYLYDELESPENEILENHIKSCRDCENKLNDLRASSRILKTALDEDQPKLSASKKQTLLDLFAEEPLTDAIQTEHLEEKVVSIEREQHEPLVMREPSPMAKKLIALAAVCMIGISVYYMASDQMKKTFGVASNELVNEAVSMPSSTIENDTIAIEKKEKRSKQRSIIADEKNLAVNGTPSFGKKKKMFFNNSDDFDGIELDHDGYVGDKTSVNIEDSEYLTKSSLKDSSPELEEKKEVPFVVSVKSDESKAGKGTKISNEPKDDLTGDYFKPISRKDMDLGAVYVGSENDHIVDPFLNLSKPSPSKNNKEESSVDNFLRKKNDQKMDKRKGISSPLERPRRKTVARKNATYEKLNKEGLIKQELSLMKSAKEAYGRNDYVSTEKIARKIVRLNPENKEAVELRKKAHKKRLSRVRNQIETNTKEEYEKLNEIESIPWRSEVIYSEDWDFLSLKTEIKKSKRKKDIELLSTSNFKVYPVNPFVKTADDHLATFSIDTDTASFGICSNYIQKGFLPPLRAVRMEEFVNAFDYNYPVKGKGDFSVYSEMMPSPFGKNLVLLKVGVKAKVLGRDEKKPAHLTFVINSSGSMAKSDRLPLVKEALIKLLDKLDSKDSISLIRYGVDSQLLLENVSIAEKEKIIRVIQSLNAVSTTHMMDGLQLAYQTAARFFDREKINRVVLCSDGVANIGESDANEILNKVKSYKQEGISFSSIGFGMGGYDDGLMESLANKGDGSYLFIHQKKDIETLFLKEFTLNLQHIAKDVKIQVDINKDIVYRYRLLGYENRNVKDTNFRNDKVDAGEIGSGQTVTALIEMELLNPVNKDLKNFGTVNIRFKNPETNEVQEIARPLPASLIRKHSIKSNPYFYLAAAVAEFAEILRESPHANGSTLKELATLVRKVSIELPLNQQVKKLSSLIQKSQGLPKSK